ncbi:hypothetical protein KAR91_53945 [Candidatus Pacearchaeota archaeon]|nr:hypothetical protein [Candidatus Pacearchaeota archaeon]
MTVSGMWDSSFGVDKDTLDNDAGVFYLLGSESVDGSIRFRVVGGLAQIERRTTGVWNTTQLVTGAG